MQHHAYILPNATHDAMPAHFASCIACALMDDCIAFAFALALAYAGIQARVGLGNTFECAGGVVAATTMELLELCTCGATNGVGCKLFAGANFGVDSFTCANVVVVAIE